MPNTEASQVATLILRGEEKEVEEALVLVKKNPNLLSCYARGKDPRGRLTAGTLLAIAAMAGDLDLKKGITEEKERGLVERLVTAGQLSPEEVREQLTVITSNEAQEENQKRNSQVLDAIKRFSKGIILKAKEYKGNDRKALQNLCKEVIDQLEADLNRDSHKVITLGYIFDLQILHDASKWFEDNVKRFGGWESLASDVWWINGFGKLQEHLSSRDAQVIRVGIGNLVEANNSIPARSLNNSDGTSYFCNSAPKLGEDFYLGYSGGNRETGGSLAWAGAALARVFAGHAGVGKLVSRKKSSIAKLMRHPGNSKETPCLIM